MTRSELRKIKFSEDKKVVVSMRLTAQWRVKK